MTAPARQPFHSHFPTVNTTQSEPAKQSRFPTTTHSYLLKLLQEQCRIDRVIRLHDDRLGLDVRLHAVDTFLRTSDIDSPQTSPTQQSTYRPPFRECAGSHLRSLRCDNQEHETICCHATRRCLRLHLPSHAHMKSRLSHRLQSLQGTIQALCVTTGSNDRRLLVDEHGAPAWHEMEAAWETGVRSPESIPNSDQEH